MLEHLSDAVLEHCLKHGPSSKRLSRPWLSRETSKLLRSSAAVRLIAVRTCAHDRSMETMRPTLMAFRNFIETQVCQTRQSGPSQIRKLQWPLKEWLKGKSYTPIYLGAVFMLVAMLGAVLKHCLGLCSSIAWGCAGAEHFSSTHQTRLIKIMLKA
jgi:hypothetical protein